MTNWNELAAIHHAAMVKNGFHDKYSHTDLLLRGIQEVGEAASAWRKNRRADMVGFRAGAKVPNIYEIAVKHSLEEEFADIALIMMDFAATNDIELSYEFPLFEADVKDSLMTIAKCISSINYFSLIDKADEYYVEYWSRIDDKVHDIFSILESLAKMFDINLEEQVKMKMEYNLTRPRKHGDKN